VPQQAPSARKRSTFVEVPRAVSRAATQAANARQESLGGCASAQPTTKRTANAASTKRVIPWDDNSGTAHQRRMVATAAAAADDDDDDDDDGGGAVVA
jgi:hypothetical protein